jgi:hypothetical protein
MELHLLCSRRHGGDGEYRELYVGGRKTFLEKTPARPSASLCSRGIGRLQVGCSRVPRKSETTPSADSALLGSDASRSHRKSWSEVAACSCARASEAKQVRALT